MKTFIIATALAALVVSPALAKSPHKSTHHRHGTHQSQTWYQPSYQPSARNAQARYFGDAQARYFDSAPYGTRSLDPQLGNDYNQRP